MPISVNITVACANICPWAMLPYAWFQKICLQLRCWAIKSEVWMLKKMLISSDTCIYDTCMVKGICNHWLPRCWISGIFPQLWTWRRRPTYLARWRRLQWCWEFSVGVLSHWHWCSQLSTFWRRCSHLWRYSFIVLTLSHPMTPYGIIVSHKLMGICMGVLILGVIL